MTTETATRVARDYIERVERAGLAIGLPKERRDALRASIGQRFDEAVLLGAGNATDLVLDEIDRIGEPGAVAQAAAAQLGIRRRPAPSGPAPQRGWPEIGALAGICVGWMFFGFGAAVALVLLVTSRCWTIPDKLLGIAAAVCPLAVTIAGISDAGSEARVNPAEQGLHVEQILGPAIFVLGILAPFFVAAYLWRRAKQPA